MIEPWNDNTILPPPVIVFSPLISITFDELKIVCDEIIKVLNNQSPLHKESAILSRLIYKFDKKFRSDIGYRNIKKINVALRKYLKNTLLRDVDNFSSVISTDAIDHHMPSRQMLEYILIRLQTFARLMYRICICAKQGTVFYLDRIRRGESHWMSLLPYAVLCRIWSMCRVLIQHACKWYEKLFTFLDILESKGMPFLPAGYELPVNLFDWLDMKHFDDEGRFNWAENRTIQVSSIPIEEDDIGFDILNYVNSLNNVEEMNIHLEEMDQVNDYIKIESMKPDVNNLKHVDHGKKIPRQSLRENVNTNVPSHNDKRNDSDTKNGKDKSSSKNVSTHSINVVISTQLLREFIAKEERLRNNKNKHSLSSHLSFMQWQALKQTLQKLCDLELNTRRFTKKFQKIWQEKCLDYLI